jgi:ADP-ribose pyrophosphatase YjhB (NUDIX family)
VQQDALAVANRAEQRHVRRDGLLHARLLAQSFLMECAAFRGPTPRRSREQPEAQRGFAQHGEQDSSNPRAWLGGHVEFGEHAADTIHREFGEEIGQQLTGVRLLGVLENIFPWQGGTEHEVVFIFSAALADEAAYEIEEQVIADDTGSRVIWRAPGTVSPPLYPAGLTELIAGA